MKSPHQKKRSFTKEMEKLKKENKLKEEKKPFEEVFKKAVTPRKKPSGR